MGTLVARGWTLSFGAVAGSNLQGVCILNSTYSKVL